STLFIRPRSSLLNGSGQATTILTPGVVSRVVIRSDSSAFSTASNASATIRAFTSSRLLASAFASAVFFLTIAPLLALAAPKLRESDLMRSEKQIEVPFQSPPCGP
ncbi:hypothetical protein, partial [Aeromonas sp. QDB50]|uniref:hypothetical protein n=1 Tax=Aeromonas sp. QDB50 TaxID=2990493 RepID=UPI0022E55640